jgi:enamine deaminase RidA (YjgF/YER057c/UK114 family)
MKQTITCENAPAAVGPFVHAKLVNGVLYTSGQLPMTVPPICSLLVLPKVS